jgi:uncharacterized protein (TIGR00255 family)
VNSMTGYGSGQASDDSGSVNVEIRTVNSRYLDLQFRLPDELRLAEMPLREKITQAVARGKVEVRASYTRAQKVQIPTPSDALLAQMSALHQQLKAHLPELGAPTFHDVIQWSTQDKPALDPNRWIGLCLQAGEQALTQLIETRSREGARLRDVLDQQCGMLVNQVDQLREVLPQLREAQTQRLAARVREALDQANAQGFAHISGEELSQRINAEANLFALRADVAEELDRLQLHASELSDILKRSQSTTKDKGVGKRLDFLFQEMNREANTLGSKASDIRITRVAMDLKLLIEQMREQIQNIE